MIKSKVAKSVENANTQAIAQSIAVLECVANAFPGLVDLETDVNGADLTEYLTRAIHWNAALRKHLKVNAK